MKNIAIICYNMIPYVYNWGCAQRVYYYASLLGESHNVHVISYKESCEPNYFNKVINFKQLFLEKKLRNNLDKSIYSKVVRLYRRIINSILYASDNFINNEPNKGMGVESKMWMVNNSENIINYLKQNHINDLIISVPPFGILIPSFIDDVKKNISGNIIIDYRDPWNCWNNKYGLSFIRERKILNIVDQIIVTNTQHRDRLIKDFKIKNDKFLILSNGYDREIWEKINVNLNPCDKLVISYIGSICLNKRGGYRDISFFLKALDKCPFKKRILLRIVGSNTFDVDKINKYYNVLIPNMELIPFVSQCDSLRFMKNSDILMNIHTELNDSSKYLMAGKIYDYYRSGTKILSINSIDSFEHKFIKENCLGYCSVNNVDEIVKVLNIIYETWKINNNMPRNAVLDKKYSRQYQNDLLLEYINKH